MDDAASDEIVVVGVAADPAVGSAQVSVIESEDLPVAADLAAAVQRAPGVVVQRLGGPGDVAQVGVRAASARYTEVLLDGISLNPDGGAAVDLSELPLSAFERVEVYRGAGPLGSTGLGGTVALVPVNGELARVQLGGGSFGTARAAATLARPIRGGHLLVNADVLHTDGDFRYFDGGAELDPADDRLVVRANDDAGQGTLLTRLRAHTGPVAWSFLHAGLWREEGIPGFTTDTLTDTVRYGIVRHVGGARAEVAAGKAAVAARISASSRAERLSDPLGEIGVGAQDRRDHSGLLGGDVQGRVAWSAAVTAGASASAREDWFSGRDLLADPAPSTFRRTVARGSVWAALHTERVDVLPALAAVATMGTGPDDDSAYALPRLGAVVRAGAITIRANASTSARPPDLLELYGDRGTFQSNPDLRPERGSQLDAGATWAGEGARAEIVGFVALTRDQIVWVTGPQRVALPVNVAEATSSGLELAGDVQRGPWSAVAQATLTLSRNGQEPYVGNLLPRVPLASGFAAATFDRGPVRLGIDATASSRIFADSANNEPQPARLLFGATATVRLPSALSVELDVRNVLGTRSGPVPYDVFLEESPIVRKPLVDFVGYPLPGRSLTCSVRWRPR